MPAQEVRSNTPLLVDFCPSDMVYGVYRTSNNPGPSCETSSYFYNSLSNTNATGTLYQFPIMFALLNTRYVTPANAFPSPPNNTVVVKRYVYYAMYRPRINACLAVTGPVCTSIGTQVLWDDATSEYPSTPPGLWLNDSTINPTNLVSANSAAVATMLREFYNATFLASALNVQLAYGNFGPKNLTRGYFELSSFPVENQIPVLDPNVFVFSRSTHERLPRPKRRREHRFFMCDNTAMGCDPFPNQRERGAPTTTPAPIRTPIISFIVTVAYFQDLIAGMNIEQSYSDTGTDRLFAYMEITGGNQDLGRQVIAQQTQFYSPLLDSLNDCPSQMTFKGLTYYNGSGATSTLSAVRGRPAAQTNPFTYATASLLYVPADGPYTVADAIVAKTADTSAYYFMYEPKMFILNGSCTCDGITACANVSSFRNYWNITTNEFSYYPLAPLDATWNPTGACFNTRAQFFAWATSKAQTFGSLISSSMASELGGAVEFVTRTIPTSVYVATGPISPTPTPAPGFPCEAVTDCTTGISSPLQVDETRCVDESELVVCVYTGPPTDSSSIVYTGEECQCTV